MVQLLSIRQVADPGPFSPPSDWPKIGAGARLYAAVTKHRYTNAQQKPDKKLNITLHILSAEM